MENLKIIFDFARNHGCSLTFRGLQDNSLEIVFTKRVDAMFHAWTHERINLEMVDNVTDDVLKFALKDILTKGIQEVTKEVDTFINKQKIENESQKKQQG